MFRIGQFSGEAAGGGRGVAVAVPVRVNAEVAVGAKVEVTAPVGVTFEKCLHPDSVKQRIIRKNLFNICSLVPNYVLSSPHAV